MLNHIKSELARLSHKKSIAIYYLVLMAFFTLIMVISRPSNVTHVDMVELSKMMLSLSSVVIGTHIFYNVFGDDLSNKTLSLVFSTGLSRIKFVISKLIVFIIFTLLVYAFFAVYFIVLWQILVGSLPSIGSHEFNVPFYSAIIIMISIIAFGMLSASLSYLFQNNNVGGIIFPLMAMGLINQILSLLALLFDWLEKPLEYLLSSLVNIQAINIQMNLSIEPNYYLIATLYILVGVIVSTISLSKKDILTN